MFNQSTIALLFSSVFFAIVDFLLLPKINKTINRRLSIYLSLTMFIASIIVIVAAFYIDKGYKTTYNEILNGKVISKERIHGSYIRFYDCNCKKSCTTIKRNQSCTNSCDICTENHYTEKWVVTGSVGESTIKELDEKSPAVYSEPDPKLYTSVKVNDPYCSLHRYTNYIKAVPESIFNLNNSLIKTKFEKMIPAYPDNLYDFWKVNRAISINVSIPNINEWSNKISEALKEIGPIKQANWIIVFVNTDDPNYAVALKDAWVNGNKNDIILVIGITDYPNKADWVDVISLSQNDIFKVKLKDDIMMLDKLTPESVITVFKEDTLSLYKRKSMKDFEYLESEIEPSNWFLYGSLLIIILLYGVHLFFINKKVFN